MGLFDFFKKKKVEDVSSPNTDEGQTNNVLLAVAMFKNNESYDIDKVIEHLESFWGLKIDEANDRNNETAVFNINGQMVAIASMPAPVPMEEIEEVAGYNFYWETAVEDLKDHTNHTIVSVLHGDLGCVERHLILSKMLCSILITSNCIGIYQGTTTQLFSKGYYLAFIDDIKNNSAITPLWIYFGVRNEGDKGVGLYTYGLTNFGKLELEILNTKENPGDMYEFLINIANYVVSKDVTFHDGETVGYTAEQKVPLSISKGVYVDGQSIKMKI